MDEQDNPKRDATIAARVPEYLADYVRAMARRRDTTLSRMICRLLMELYNNAIARKKVNLVNNKH